MKWFLQLALLLLVASVRSQDTTNVVVPSATTSIAPSPMPTPTPSPLLRGTWNVTKINKTEVCVKMAAKLQMDFTYWKLNPTNETAPPVEGTRTLQFSNDANVSTNLNFSFCDRPGKPNHYESQITLNATHDNNPFLLSFTFEEDTRKGHRLWQLTGIQLEFTAVNGTVFPNYTSGSSGTTVTVVSDKLNFDNELQRSFRCDSPKTVSLKTLPQGNITAVSIHFEDWRVQAFEFKEAGEFGQARRCQTDLNKKDNTVVPIAVGAALGALVIIIILAYLFGRFRAHRKSASYEPL